jgi:hypothetical protein
MFRPAIIYNDNDIFVELSPDDFVRLLVEYSQQDEVKIKEAIDRMISDLKKRTLYK